MGWSLRRSVLKEIAVGLDSTVSIPLYDSSVDALDPTGYTAEWKLFRGVARRTRKPFTGSSVLTKTSDAGEITLSNGNASVAILAADLALYSGDMWQVLTLTDGSGNITQQVQGPVILRAVA